MTNFVTKISPQISAKNYKGKCKIWGKIEKKCFEKMQSCATVFLEGSHRLT